MTVEVTVDAGRGAAVEQVTRTMSLAIGVGAAMFALLSIPPFLAQLHAVHPVWSWATASLVFGPPMVMALLFARAPLRLLKTLAGVSAAAHLIALATYLPALPGGSLEWSLGTPWLLGVTVIPSATAAIAWRPAITWPYVFVCVTLIWFDRSFAAVPPVPQLAAQDALHTLLFVSIFTALAFTTYRAGHALDAAADAAIAETRSAAANAARTRERARVEALLHDTVLVALLASARGSSQAPDEARAASAQIELLDAPQDADDAAVDGATWTWRLQALTTELAPDALFSHEIHDTAPVVVAAAGDAVLEATAEALRNSVQHAGRAARAVHARVDAEGLTVTVLDDGIGFDPETVRPGRLGIAVSVLGRMRAVPGGKATIVSRPGVGTRVDIRWRAAA